MSKTITIIRVAVILCLGLVAVFGIFCQPGEELSFPAWASALLLSKAVGCLAAYAAYRLYCLWRDNNLFTEFEKLCANE